MLNHNFINNKNTANKVNHYVTPKIYLGPTQDAALLINIILSYAHAVDNLVDNLLANYQ